VGHEPVDLMPVVLERPVHDLVDDSVTLDGLDVSHAPTPWSRRSRSASGADPHECDSAPSPGRCALACSLLLLGLGVVATPAPIMIAGPAGSGAVLRHDALVALVAGHGYIMLLLQRCCQGL